MRGARNIFREAAFYRIFLLIVLLFFSQHLYAQKTVPGAVTNFPVPRFVSLNSDKANMRRGPSTYHRIDWVYRHKGLPIMVIGEYGNWRRVRDHEGITGWIHHSLLSGRRMALIKTQRVILRAGADERAAPKAIAERNALLKIESCSIKWCSLSHKSGGGWLPKKDMWGMFEEEIF